MSLKSDSNFKICLKHTWGQIWVSAIAGDKSFDPDYYYLEFNQLPLRAFYLEIFEQDSHTNFKSEKYALDRKFDDFCQKILLSTIFF